MDILAGFVGTGINANDCTIVIATASHIEKLQQRLSSHGLHIHRLVEDERYIPVAAEEIMPKFMVNGLPDEQLFNQCISDIMAIAKHRNRPVRAFREMAALLEIEGNTIASSKLQSLWNKFSQQETLLLFYATPSTVFTKEARIALQEEGFTHSKMVKNSNTISEILYKDCSQQ